MEYYSTEDAKLIHGQNKAIAALGREIDDLKKELKRSNEHALRHVNAYHELANKTEHVGKINSWNQIWMWFQGFKPLQDLREKVLTDADGQIGAASLMAETISEYVNRFGE